MKRRDDLPDTPVDYWPAAYLPALHPDAGIPYRLAGRSTAAALSQPDPDGGRWHRDRHRHRTSRGAR